MIKTLARFFLLASLVLLTLYLIFLSTVSIVTGVTHTETPGFWMPLLYGVLLLCLAFFLIRLVFFIVKQIKAKERYPYP